MQALILAAGVGKRLKPITDTIPKCLVPVNGKPMLINALELLESHGIKEVVLLLVAIYSASTQGGTVH